MSFLVLSNSPHLVGKGMGGEGGGGKEKGKKLSCFFFTKLKKKNNLKGKKQKNFPAVISPN